MSDPTPSPSGELVEPCACGESGHAGYHGPYSCTWDREASPTLAGLIGDAIWRSNYELKRAFPDTQFIDANRSHFLAGCIVAALSENRAALHGDCDREVERLRAELADLRHAVDFLCSRSPRCDAALEPVQALESGDDLGRVRLGKPGLGGSGHGRHGAPTETPT